MPIDDSPKVNTPPPRDAAAATPGETIVSVNSVGRRQGTRAGPFVAVGAIAAVVLIGGWATIGVIKSKFTGPKPLGSSQTAATAGLSKSFDTDDQRPELPGASTPSAANTPTVATPVCADGSAGNELRGQDGVVVRNAQGQGVRVCPNGQVIGATAPQGGQEAPARPIPVEGRRGPVSASPASTGRFMGPGGASSGPTMLNDGKYGSAQIVPDLTNPEAVAGAVAQVAAAAQPKTEGLLTTAPQGSLEAELIPSKTPMIEAARIDNLNLLLPKGHTIDCALSMRIVSSLAGEVSCIVTSNVYSANGRVVLLERGSEAVGEYRSGASIGQKRLFVLWTRVITPGGVVINLDSPGADELGSTGLAGTVDDHWFERIGSAFLLSTVQDAIQYEVAQEQAKAGSSTLVFSSTAQTGNTMAQKVLEATINIPPTLFKNQGDRAIIYVARDLDFSNVYRLRPR